MTPAEPLTADLWNVLHDGGVDRVEGAVPGTVRLHCYCQYLRKSFEEPGDGFVITLYGCTSLTYQPYTADEATDDFDAIGEAADFLSAEVPTEIFGMYGWLRLEAAGYSLALDTGRPIALDDLKAVAAAYWTEFSERTG